LVYAGSSALAGFGSAMKYEVPRFGLPLNDIEWSFFMLPGHRYSGFGGTMEQEAGSDGEAKQFNTQIYSEFNKQVQRKSIQRAKEVLDVGEKYVKAGKQKQARRALQEAVNYSQADADLNEDARVQYRNLVKQQVKMGLLNRRAAVRFSQNIIDERQLGQMEDFQDGEYTQEYAQRLEGDLSSKDNDALEVVAEKMLEQQTAAAGMVSAIRVTMPEHGRLIRFSRATHIEPKDELSVSFRMGTGRLRAVVGQVLPALVMFFALWGVLAAMRKREKAA
jgi:hypothetical protein